MASKFLRFQDLDRDGLIDVCDDVIQAEEVPCKAPCTPNPSAIISNWRNMDGSASRLNEKLCKYESVKITPYTFSASQLAVAAATQEDDETVADAELRQKFEEFIMEAVEQFITDNDRLLTPETKDLVARSVEFAQWDLDPRPGSRLKLLYRVPFEVIFNLPDEREESDSGDDDINAGEVVVILNAAQMMKDMLRIRRGLNFYGRMLKVRRALGAGNVKFIEGPKEGAIFDLDLYGDGAFFETGILDRLMTDLDGFLDSKGLRLPGEFFGFLSGDERVTKLKFYFNDYKLTKMKVWTIECSNKPRVYGRRKLKSLNKSQAWRDKTAVAYFAQCPQMSISLNARVQIPYTEFVEKYTYPGVKFEDGDELSKYQTAGSCIATALNDELKDLGQDILDDVFSLGDAVAYMMRDAICRGDIEGADKDEKLVGLTMGPDGPDKAKIFAMASEQAYKQIETSDNMFVILCAGVFASTTSWGPAKQKLAELFKFGLHRIKQCGLFDLIMGAISCLSAGMTGDEFLSTMVMSALKSMGVEELGQLFVGLPADKQAEIEAMVMQQLEDGEFFSSLGMAPKPWENQAIIDKERADRIEGSYEGSVTPKTSKAYKPQGAFVAERSLIEAYDAGIAGERGGVEPQVDNVIEAYLVALVEVYSDNLLALVDELNKFPGAQIVASILGFLDCPHPPFMHPSVMDFIKDITLPFCRNMGELRTTRWMFENPLLYFADFTDITKKLWDIAKWMIMQILAIIVFNIIVKICEIIGKAICAALELGADIVTSLPAAMAGRANLKDVIRESICGPDTPDEQIDETLVDLMSQVGMGASAYADRETTLQFGLDLSSSVTQIEMSQALLGDPSDSFLEVVDQLIEFEYPQLRESMPNRAHIGKFFSNIGNITPLPYRAKLQEFLEVPEDDKLPVNPSICASPEKIEEFRKLRAKLLEGRTTPKQAQQLFCDFRDQNMQDLQDLSDLMQGGIPSLIEDGMPSMVSEPGCEDGLLPYESREMASVNMEAVGGQLESLKIAYIEDMLGNGSFWNSDSSWGFINMVLSDTKGNPLTAHHRKAFNNKSYVNFATNLKNGGESTSGFFSFFQSSAGFSAQEGQFPYYVGEWLMRQFLNAGEGSGVDYLIKPGFYNLKSMGKDLMFSVEDGFRSNNDVRGKKRHRIDFEDLQYNNLFGSLTQGVNLFMIPDFGYNTTVSMDQGAEQVIVTREIRKGGQSPGDDSHHKRDGADISLDFRDNAAGMRLGGKDETNSFYASGNDGNGKDQAMSFSTEWSYGFDLKCYYHDVYEQDDGTVLNRFDDNMRVEIVEKLNWGSDHVGPLGEALEDDFLKVPMFDLPNWIENVPLVGWAIESVINLVLYPFTNIIGKALARAIMRASERVLRIREFEFLAVDDSLDCFNKAPYAPGVPDPHSLDIADFPKFSTVLRTLPDVSPPVLLLSDMTNLSVGAAKTEYDMQMTALYKRFCLEIGRNKTGFLYGANYDFLTSDDIEYGIIERGKFIPYYAYTLDGNLLSNEDMVLGVSRDVYNNGDNARVIYLDPKVFGGSYLKPPLYIKPTKHEGWYGFVNVLFPEYTPCKPHNQDLIDFDELKGWVYKYYPNMPEDPRLTQGSEECTREVPFKRILNRHAKISLYVTVLAAIRIYVSTHIFKALPVFSKIMPKFPDNYSTIYAAYIVERMEEDFKDAQPAFWEAFSTFKDEEFWYSFLEQSVECYDFLVEAGAIEAPVENGFLQEAFDTINNLQTDYGFTYRKTTTRRYRRSSDGNKVRQTVLGMHDKKMAGEAGWFQSLKGIRSDENLEAVQSVEEHAKLILMQLVNHELSVMGEKMVGNMRKYGFNPDIFDLDYYIFENMCANSSLKFAGPKVIEKPMGLPTPENPDPQGRGTKFPGPYYSDGGEFRVAINKNDDDGHAYGEEFKGAYHAHIDEYGDVIYMAGEYHSEDPDAAHDVLTPIDQLVIAGTEGYSKSIQDETAIEAYGSSGDNPDMSGTQDAPDPDAAPYPKITKTFVPIGDVPEYGSITGPAEDGKMYGLEKYVSINGSKYPTNVAQAMIRGNQDINKPLTDYYPGTMEIITNQYDEEIGVVGEMGVRFGLAFYFMSGNGKREITTVEVDSLDVTCAQFHTSLANSKLLMCLINKMKEDPKYKLMTSYIFSIKKVTGTLAMYSDMALLSSIGEVTPGYGDSYAWLPTTDFFAAWPLDGLIAKTNRKKDWLGNTSFDQVKVKPGSRAYIYKKEEEYSIEQNTPPSLFNPFGSDDPIEGTTVTFNMKKSGVTGNEGWQHYFDRQPGFFAGLWVCEWDNWDRILLRNSKARIKRLFRRHYYSRDFKPGDPLLDRDDQPSIAILRNLRGQMFPSPATGMVPWWARGMLRDNPYNANDTICEGKD